jgi:hypothetical protein
MNNPGMKLSSREALEGSLSFLGQFVQKYWPLVVLYIVIGILPAFVIGDQDPESLSMSQKVQLGAIGLLNVIPSLLMIFYPLREALLKLDPNKQIANKSLAKGVWQIFCVNIISVVLGIPLLLLLILPGIWWSTKSTVALADLLSTNDGAIASIRKSHQLMNGKFWQCLGFLVATSSTVILVTTVIGVTIGFFLLVGGLLNVLFHEGASFNKVFMMIRILGPIFAVFTSIAFYYFQAWLYVYLKQDEVVSAPLTPIT